MSVLTLLFLSTALGAAPAAGADGLSLALIVANNRSAQLGRPPLQYAAMDGAKYHELFASFLGEENTVLLTDLDRDTARLFPGLVASARSPTRANVDEAVRSLARRAAEARRAGRLVRFYFAFAGHGDVDKGRGFLELIDGPFTSDDLDALLRRIGASEAHVILDSCNSFFVVNPRRPGGRRFGTPRDAAENLARRLPNVGVFLSTSAEAEVYEWSELQSGVFSHAVRSGLMGAADARHNGRITYQELAAFVDTASAEIKNPLFRPRVFARGPNGDNDRVILDVSTPPQVLLKVAEPEAVRLVARDADGLRWLDAHKEPGETLELRLPRSLASRLEVERLKTAGPDAGAVEATYTVPAGATGPLTLLALAPGAPSSEARGAGDIFRALFARPFGPRALAAYLEERSREPEPVYGISRDEAERMGLLHAGAADRVPIRARKKWAITAEGGWNGLAGVGANLTYNVIPRLSLDLGLGLSMAVGVKGGARVRLNLLESSWTPIVGLGFLFGSGGEDGWAYSKADAVRVNVRPSPFLQTVAGVNYTGGGGFTLMATAGYAFLLRKENVEFVSGSTKAFDDARDFCGSGVVLGLSLGYAF
jgi:hypothetical protein